MNAHSSMQVGKVTVSPRALIQRINRRLEHSDERLKTYRGGIPDSNGYLGRWFSGLGRYYIVDLPRNSIVCSHVDLENLARELDAIGGCEALENDE